MTAEKTDRTRADVLVDAIYARARVQAWIAGAFVHVDFTVHPEETSFARTLINTEHIDTVGFVLTRHTGAFVDVLLAEHTAVTDGADAGEVTKIVDAHGVVQTR